jgi:hypothetical protein
MGDYNSRSLVSNSKMYIKNISPNLCETNSDTYCEFKSNLESLTLDTHTKLYGQLQPTDNQLNKLVTSNTFNKFKEHRANLKEYPITFLPTYKRQTQKQSQKTVKKTKNSLATNTLKSIKLPGQFSLEKGSNSSKTFRLPGYADRITVIGDNINLLPDENMYTSIPVFGNDHIPVVATFEVQSYPVS